jgi:lysophospholipase L1-like esterase
MAMASQLKQFILSRPLKKVLLALVSVFLALVVFEVFLRLIGYSYTPLSIEVINTWSEWRFYHSFQDEHFVYDSSLLWRPREGDPMFNSQGYRGEEISADKKPGSYRIFAIGDSNTLGWRGKDGPNWPADLQELLRKKSDRFTVVNAGVYGYSSFQGLRRFQEAIRFQPDMVLISFGCNDAMRVTMSDKEFADRKVRSIGLDTTLVKFRLGQLFLACSDRIVLGGKEGLVPRVSLPEYEDNLGEIIRLAEEKKMRVVLLTRPFIDPSIDPSPHKLWWREFASAYNDATREVAKRSGVPVVDIYSHFKGKKEYFVDECHFTKEGHGRAAKIIADRILPLVPDAGP